MKKFLVPLFTIVILSSCKKDELTKSQEVSTDAGKKSQPSTLIQLNCDPTNTKAIPVGCSLNPIAGAPESNLFFTGFLEVNVLFPTPDDGNRLFAKANVTTLTGVLEHIVDYQTVLFSSESDNYVSLVLNTLKFTKTRLIKLVMLTEKYYPDMTQENRFCPKLRVKYVAEFRYSAPSTIFNPTMIAKFDPILETTENIGDGMRE